MTIKEIKEIINNSKKGNKELLTFRVNAKLLLKWIG